jgi:sterol desaturase/sphingolipid hydroxylase (fatty acid hydroxylase superfamily)
MVDTKTTSQQPKTSMAYIAWSAEKKKCLMMYLWLGIVLSVSRDTMSVFEYFHLRQSLGRRMVFMIVVLLSVLLMFLPLIWLIGWLMIVLMLVIWWLFGKQAWIGQYYDKVESATLPLFVGMWWWILQMFDTEIKIEGQEEDVQIK